ncbi:hypothetical protein LNAOJCKE_4681 [Methylorubrum aminovorans]|jgi:hypothetical protein|uniref:Uncharacterized protein n=1 Tax=Methylorubrum aminovorans TaxID=269069 RepID=A0ABQ4UJI4_9HYPH|nr:hypothetical protein LNAOJCKE_4681 [Methylorubrum aminovorans]GLS55431.1 hypothetical protein GCM10007886_36160 [Methylobacterium gregans]GMA74771.1 hypothetical protein GCM10025880_11880 [Methylorubrum aminovorans]
MRQVKVRLIEPGLPPRRTRLKIPGWAGDPEPRTEGSQDYAWHCIPLLEAVKGGIELFYAYDAELGVSTRAARLVFEGISPSPADRDRKGRRSGASARPTTPIGSSST